MPWLCSSFIYLFNKNSCLSEIHKVNDANSCVTAWVNVKWSCSTHQTCWINSCTNIIPPGISCQEVLLQNFKLPNGFLRMRAEQQGAAWILVTNEQLLGLKTFHQFDPCRSMLDWPCEKEWACLMPHPRTQHSQKAGRQHWGLPMTHLWTPRPCQ